MANNKCITIVFMFIKNPYAHYPKLVKLLGMW